MPSVHRRPPTRRRTSPVRRSPSFEKRLISSTRLPGNLPRYVVDHVATIVDLGPDGIITAPKIQRFSNGNVHVTDSNGKVLLILGCDRNGYTTLVAANGMPPHKGGRVIPLMYAQNPSWIETAGPDHYDQLCRCNYCLCMSENPPLLVPTVPFQQRYPDLTPLLNTCRHVRQMYGKPRFDRPFSFNFMGAALQDLSADIDTVTLIKELDELERTPEEAVISNDFQSLCRSLNITTTKQASRAWYAK